MYKLTKNIIIKIFPAALLYRLEPVIRKIASWWYAGSRYYCPVCSRHYRAFIPLSSKDKADLLCPGCGSIPRKRLLWYYLVNELEIKNRTLKCLHFSPQRYLARALKGAVNGEYITTDYEGPHADKNFDITGIEEKDNTYDLVICYHILEHIPDDKKAMAELFRIIKPGGILLAQVPHREAATYEDAAISDPEEREKLFGQADHVRFYGREDFVNRLQQAGFQVKENRYANSVPEKLMEQSALRREEVIFVGKK